MTSRTPLVLLLLAWASHSAAAAGTYSFTATEDPPFAILHPYGYTGQPGSRVVSVCLGSSAEPLLASLQTAISIWNAQSPVAPNCTGPCSIHGEPNPSGDYISHAVLLHELGHCAFGLGEINWTTGPGGPTSFTNTRGASSISAGADGIPGSKDDIASPLPGARVIHWFRKSDNDPFVTDSTVIDSVTYSRVRDDLASSGSLWPASANRVVGTQLGQPDFTQSVMYQGQSRSSNYEGLTADEINTISYAKAGLDEVADGDDDYTVSLAFVPDCVDADVEVLLEPAEPGELGSCLVARSLIPIPGEVDRHFRLSPLGLRAVIRLRVNAGWEFSTLPFIDGLESGTFDGWSTHSP